jgi:hypothetical protein
MTAFEVAEFVGCHEETVRRAYWRGLLASQRSASEEGGFCRQTSSTGSVEAYQLESRKSEGGSRGCTKTLQGERLSGESALRPPLVV